MDADNIPGSTLSDDDEIDGLLDALACDDISQTQFVRRYMALGYSREEAIAVINDNITLGNIDR